MASKEWRAAYYQSRMQEYYAYLGGKCSCGSTERLEIDHVDPKLKCFGISEHYDSKWEILKPELDKCQLLCSDCHKKKHAAQHGTLGMHRHCRCELCQTVWLEYHRERRRKIKAAKALR